jgi:chromosomal replication initiator protein
LEITKKLLEDFIKKPRKSITPQDAINAITAFYDISEEKIKGDCRRKDFVKARQITMYVLREVVKMSYPAIGSIFNNKDHTTVMHSCKKIDISRKKDSILNQEIDSIIEKLNYDVLK